MLETIRAHAYTFGTRVLLVFLVVVFVFFFGVTGYYLRARPIATVGCGSIPFLTTSACRQIMPDDIDRETRNLRNIFAKVYGQNADSILRAMNLRQTAVEQLIQQALILNEAQRLGLSISDDALAKTISSQTAFQTDGRFDVDRYREILRENDLVSRASSCHSQRMVALVEICKARAKSA